MKKIIFILLILIFLVGCEEVKYTKYNIAKSSDYTTVVIDNNSEESSIKVTKQKEIENEVKVVETVKETKNEGLSCNDECNQDKCNDMILYECLKQTDGCKYLVEKGKVKGECGISCLSDDDCNSDSECKNYECTVVDKAPEVQNSDNSGPEGGFIEQD